MPTATEAKKRLRGYRGEHVAVAIWSEEDVLGRAKELKVECSREQAREIIDEIDRKQDCSLGISWDTIDYFVWELKDKAENKQ